ncbi:MAG: sigma-70 family RNA polymerase sigma factor [Planctomycetota bacterium]
MDEQALIDRAQAGDADALGELLIAHRSACFAFALQLGVCHADAEGICQNAFLCAAKKVASYRPTGSFRSWLFSLVLRAWTDWLDADHARQRREKEYAMQRHKIAVVEINAAESRELQQGLADSMARLEDKYRLPVALHYMHGLSYSETAIVLDIPEGTVATNIRRGLEKLRDLMTTAGYACVTPVLTTTLSQIPQAAAPASLTAYIQSLTVSVGVKSAGAITAAKTVGVALGWKIVASIFVATFLGFGGYQSWTRLYSAIAIPIEETAAEAETGPVKPAKSSDIIITPRSCDAWNAFDEIARRGGTKVFMLGGRKTLLVPVELRFKPVEGRKLIEAVAAARNLKVVWIQDGRRAVLYSSVSDERVERVRKELALADVVARREAVWRASWMFDARITPLLVKAAKDVDAKVAQQAITGLRRMTWDVVLALDETAVDLLAAELNSQDACVRYIAIKSASSVGEEKALAFIEKALIDQDVEVRRYAMCAFGRMSAALAGNHREKASLLLEKALTDQDVEVRSVAAFVLGDIGGEKALALIEKALTDNDADVCRNAISALGNIGGSKALALIEKNLTSQNVNARHGAARALDRMDSADGLKALALIEKALTDNDANVCRNAISALGHIGGSKALVFSHKRMCW